MSIEELYTGTYRFAKINDDLGYYLVSAKPSGDKEYYVSLFTKGLGFEGKHELRQVDKIMPSLTMKMFEILDYPIGQINTEKELVSFLNIGGHAIILQTLFDRVCEEMIKPKKVIGSQDEGFLDFDTLDKKYKQRFAIGTYRIEIIQRDRNQCRVCGASPEDSPHIRLEAHHIKPWEEGGVSIPENLITLCHTCHSGIKGADRDVLYKKIGVVFPNDKHLVYKINSAWGNEQYRRFTYLTSNSVIIQLKAPPKTLKKGI